MLIEVVGLAHDVDGLTGKRFRRRVLAAPRKDSRLDRPAPRLGDHIVARRCIPGDRTEPPRLVVLAEVDEDLAEIDGDRRSERPVTYGRHGLIPLTGQPRGLIEVARQCVGSAPRNRRHEASCCRFPSSSNAALAVAFNSRASSSRPGAPSCVPMPRMGPRIARMRLWLRLEVGDCLLRRRGAVDHGHTPRHPGLPLPRLIPIAKIEKGLGSLCCLPRPAEGEQVERSEGVRQTCAGFVTDPIQDSGEPFQSRGLHLTTRSTRVDIWDHDQHERGQRARAFVTGAISVGDRIGQDAVRRVGASPAS